MLAAIDYHMSASGSHEAARQVPDERELLLPFQAAKQSLHAKTQTYGS